MKSNKRNTNKFRKKVREKNNILKNSFGGSLDYNFNTSLGLMNEKNKQLIKDFGFGSQIKLSHIKTGDKFDFFKITNLENIKEKLDYVFKNNSFEKFLEFKKGLEEFEKIGDLEDLLGLKYTQNGICTFNDFDIYEDLNNQKNTMINELLSSSKDSFLKGIEGLSINNSNSIQPSDKCCCGSSKMYLECCLFDEKLKKDSKLPDWFFEGGGGIYSDFEMSLYGDKNINNDELSMIDLLNGLNTNQIKKYNKGLRWLIEQRNPYSLLKVIPIK